MCGFNGPTFDGNSREDYPLLRLPHAGSSPHQWAEFFPIERFPRMPDRKWRYYTEPFIGISVVAVTCAVLIGLTTAAAGNVEGDAARISKFLVSIEWLWAFTAAACVAYLLFGETGVINRAPHISYPIPVEAATQLAQGQPLHVLRNINGPQGSSYCVRCLVWRSGSAKNGAVHHCNTCGRCVSGFDHHCNVFGRCITSANMPCFYMLIAMLFAGVVTAAIAMFVAGSQSHLRTLVPHSDVHGAAHHPWHMGGPIFVN